MGDMGRGGDEGEGGEGEETEEGGWTVDGVTAGVGRSYKLSLDGPGSLEAVGFCLCGTNMPLAAAACHPVSVSGKPRLHGHYTPLPPRRWGGYGTRVPAPRV